MIVVENLSKHFKRKPAVTDLSFEVPDGTITGFLGPNGSGKSTTFQCMLGLIRPTAGRVIWRGADYEGEFPALANKHRVAGALLDAQWADPKRSGRDHLRVIARGAGISDTRVEECLDMVGMTDVADTRIGKYSLGMKQRIHVAAALLGDPQHYIFDEPVNGLDPEGVNWVRQMMQQLAASGRSVIVSSHLLSEMQITAKRLVVIGQGQLIGQYSMDEFLAQGQSITVESPEIQRLHSLLNMPGRVEQQTLHLTGVHDEAGVRQRIAEVALENGILITQLATASGNLEAEFLRLTAGAQEYRTRGAGESGIRAQATPGKQQVERMQEPQHRMLHNGFGEDK
ncbi:MAG: ATP-binding cassette domain-containing protein [Corynebacterium sp.]|nr:ATP-binding cassette domain-containing protein [Corynebacterium sp.]